MSKDADIPVKQVLRGDWIDVARTVPDQSVHCIITSPPYWGQRDYGAEGQLGLEPTFQEHIEKLVVGFREMKRILRDDGIMWVNYGDKYASAWPSPNDRRNIMGQGPLPDGKRKARPPRLGPGVKDGSLIGLAWRLALALQDDGWILRSDVIWAKAVSFNPKYSGSTMPESVNGTRWERCRVKVKGAFNSDRDHSQGAKRDTGNTFRGVPANGTGAAQYKPCPGCPKCEKNGGYVLRRGSWRPTRAHEYVFQFVKQIPYYADMEAVKEELVTDPAALKARVEAGWQDKIDGQATVDSTWKTSYEPSGRNIRDVWTINPQAYPDAHYATFPETLVEPMIKVSTSKKGVCPKCGSQWARVIEAPQGGTTGQSWCPTCNCEVSVPFGSMGTTDMIPNPVPAILYDPFMGSGTVAAVAARMGRNYLGSEVSQEYIDNHIKPRIQEAETGISRQELQNGQGALFG